MQTQNRRSPWQPAGPSSLARASGEPQILHFTTSSIMCCHYVISKLCFPGEKPAMLSLRQLDLDGRQKSILHSGTSTYIDADKASATLPRAREVTCKRPGESTRSQGWSIPSKCSESVTLRSGPSLSVIHEVLNTRCRSPRGGVPPLEMGSVTHSSPKVPARLPVRNIYRTDILTTINDNCFLRNGATRWESSKANRQC